MSRNGALKGFGIAVVSAAAGAGVAWYVTNKKLTEDYEERLDKEVQESVKFILNQMGRNDVVVSDEDPDELAEALNEAEQPVEVVITEGTPDEIGALITEGPGIGAEATVEEPTVSEMLAEFENEVSAAEKIFGSQEEKPPLEDLAKRNQATAYHKISSPDEVEETDRDAVEVAPPAPENPDISIISRDIFMENGTGWEQETLTYFADDGVLNVAGDFVEDHELLIGQGRPHFGELSEDANVVYLRNKKVEKEFEIIADPGKASDFLAHSLQQTFRPSWQQ